MERYNDIGMLDLIHRPAFCAADGRVTRVNAPAAALGIETGMDVAGLLETDADEYAAFRDGCLNLTLTVRDQSHRTSVHRMEGYDVFRVEDTEDVRALHAMALAARELRNPLDAVMATIQQLFPVEGLKDDSATRRQVGRMNRGLLQMLRVIGNMSDAVQPITAGQMEPVDIPAVLDEIFAKAAALLEHTQMKLTYEGYPESVQGLADRDQLERAVLNMISNAIRVSHPGDTIRAALTRRGRKLYLTVTDTGSGMPKNVRGDMFTRYQRSCNFEPERFGIGLGMVLIRAAAAAHGGTVLVKSTRAGTAVTMSLAIRQGGTTVRSNILKVSYTGGWDSNLVELSQYLPEDLYKDEI